MQISSLVVVFVSKSSNWTCPANYKCMYELNTAFLNYQESKFCILFLFRYSSSLLQRFLLLNLFLDIKKNKQNYFVILLRPRVQLNE